MKRKTTKGIIRLEEQNVARALKTFLLEPRQPTNNKALAMLNSALAHLLAGHLRLNRSWDWKQRWIDDVQWTSLTSAESGVNGTGKVWWGHRNQPPVALSTIDFDACLTLVPGGRNLRIKYDITIEEATGRFRISL